MTDEAQAKPKAKRGPKSPSLTIKQKFDVLSAISAASPTTPDATLAATLSASTGREISSQQVGKYRKELGLASVAKPKAADLLAQLEAAQKRIAELQGAATF